MSPRTKIVCTIGPASEKLETIRAMLRAGMTVARLNFSHGTAAGKRELVLQLRRAAAMEGRLLALMGDLQGPKIRVGEVPPDGLRLREGEEVRLVAGPIADPARDIPFPHPDVLADLHPGARILLDDGNLELQVVAREAQAARCRVITGGLLFSHKGVNLPGVPLRISALTEKDRADAALALEMGLDYLALSFVRRAEEIVELREYLYERLGGHPRRRTGADPHHIPAIVAKIEKPEALENLEAIVREADAVMVARGDLGVETAPEEVPLAQKRIIRLCNRMGKPVITATQMLQSMVEHPRPTRAEASDVANAILDGSDAVMLSNETAVGRYPVEAVGMMARIAEKVEGSPAFPYGQLLEEAEAEEPLPHAAMISRAISRATVEIARECHARAIITSTESGRTARTVSRHRPPVHLVAATPFETTARRLQLVWGVTPLLVPPFRDTDTMIQTMVRSTVEAGFAAVGDVVVLTAGIPFEVHGVTNMLKVHTVREADVAR